MLNHDEQEALERIRREHHGNRSVGGTDEAVASNDPNNGRLSEYEVQGDIGQINLPITTPGSADATTGAFDRSGGRKTEPVGNPGSGNDQDYSGDTIAVPGSEARVGAGAGSSLNGLKLKLKKPQGITPVPSFAEQQERIKEPEPPQDEIVKVLRTSKDGLRKQVLIKPGNGGRPLFRWIDVSDTPISRSNEEGAARGRVVVDNTIKTDKGPSASAQPQKQASSKSSSIKVKRGIMSASEAEELREDLEKALIEGFELVDKVVTGTLKNHPALEIWSDIDDGDIAFLADMRLRAAQRSEKAAIAVRYMVQLHEQVRLGSILVPRFIKTWQAYMEFGFEVPGAPLRRRQKASRAA